MGITAARTTTPHLGWFFLSAPSPLYRRSSWKQGEKHAARSAVDPYPLTLSFSTVVNWFQLRLSWLILVKTSWWGCNKNPPNQSVIYSGHLLQMPCNGSWVDSQCICTPRTQRAEQRNNADTCSSLLCESTRLCPIEGSSCSRELYFFPVVIEWKIALIFLLLTSAAACLLDITIVEL